MTETDLESTKLEKYSLSLSTDSLATWEMKKPRMKSRMKKVNDLQSHFSRLFHKNSNIKGWIKSGDLGYYDEELNLFMVDRKRDIINYFGRPIAPSEIENLIMNIKGVKQVCVVGIPDILSNDLTTALIVKHPGSPLMEDEVSIECSSEKSLTMKCTRFH